MLPVESYHTVFPRRHQLPDVVHRVEDDMVQEFTPVHCHRTVLVHPDVRKKTTANTQCVSSQAVTKNLNDQLGILSKVSLYKKAY